MTTYVADSNERTLTSNVVELLDSDTTMPIGTFDTIVSIRIRAQKASISTSDTARTMEELDALVDEIKKEYTWLFDELAKY